MLLSPDPYAPMLLCSNKAPGLLNKSGSSLKLGWGGTSSNGGGVALRLGIGKAGNKSWYHQDIPGIFVPNNIANPIIKNLQGK